MKKTASQAPAIAITPEQWEIVSGILQKHAPDKEVWAFGSRTTHSAKPYSDLDLAIISDTGLTLSVIAAIEHDFSESDLPFRVDVVDWATTNLKFREIIENHKIRIK